MGSAWFGTSSHVTRRLTGSGIVERPWGLLHARGVGDATTLCGIGGAAQWRMFFDVSFPVQHSSGVCPTCRRAAEDLARRSA